MQHRFNNDVLASNAHQCQFESSNPENPDSDNNYGHASHKYQQNLATYVKLNLNADSPKRTTQGTQYMLLTERNVHQLERGAKKTEHKLYLG